MIKLFMQSGKILSLALVLGVSNQSHGISTTFVIYTFPCMHAYADIDKHRLEQLIQTGHCDSA